MRAFGTYAYRGTIVGEASHPSSATPGVDPRSGAGPASRRWSLIVPCENDPRPSGGEGRERERERDTTLVVSLGVFWGMGPQVWEQLGGTQASVAWLP